MPSWLRVLFQQISASQLLSEQSMAAPRLIQWLLVQRSGPLIFWPPIVVYERPSIEPASSGSGVFTMMMKFVEWPLVFSAP